MKSQLFYTEHAYLGHLTTITMRTTITIPQAIHSIFSDLSEAQGHGAAKGFVVVSTGVVTDGTVDAVVG